MIRNFSPFPCLGPRADASECRKRAAFCDIIEPYLRELVTGYDEKTTVAADEPRSIRTRAIRLPVCCDFASFDIDGREVDSTKENMFLIDSD